MKCKNLLAVSVLPALLVVPALADTTPFTAEANDIVAAQEYTGYNNTDKNKGGVLTVAHNTDGVSVESGASFIDNTNAAATLGGAIKALSGIEIGDNVTFSGNTVSNKAWGAGALYIRTAEKAKKSSTTELTIGKNNTFSGNSAAYAGAIGLEYGDVTIGDGTTFSRNSASVSNGGAIVVWQDADDRPELHSTLTLNNNKFEQNTATQGKGGAIYVEDTGATVNVNGGSFTSNVAVWGGAIYNMGTLNVDGTEFNTNQSTGWVSEGSGGAIYNKGNATIENSSFAGNYSSQNKDSNYQHGSAGGAIVNATGATLKLVDTDFSGNHTTFFEESFSGGAILNSGTISEITGGTFENNYSSYGAGGAIISGYGAKITKIDGTEFIGNYSKSTGGAIRNIGEIGTIQNATFVGNGIQGYGTADAHVVTASGGAIGSAYSADGQEHSTIKIGLVKNSVFRNNQVLGDVNGIGGGAIWNHSKNPVVEIQGSTFESNKSGRQGGALIGKFNISDNSEFTSNYAATSGGAIAWQGGGTISDATFTSNVAGQDGGAIELAGKDISYTLTRVKFTGNYVDDTAKVDANDKFDLENGVADWQRGGGAVYSQGTLTVEDSSFDGNHAGGVGGAISNWWGDANLTVTNTEFKNNYSDYGYGGAIFNSEKITSLTTDSGNVFSNNTAVAGGAIANMPRYGEAKGRFATIDSIDGYTFANNSAVAKDDALIRVQDGDDKGKFENASDEYRAHVDGMGGAIYNENTITSMSNVTFTGNTATDFGGAIYNASAASITMSGINQFGGNTANGVANDIHNDGALTIAGGETTIDGGITGNGVFTLASGAVLNMGTTTISQGTLTLNGAINAVLNSATDYAHLIGDVTFGADSELRLTVSSVGTYKMFTNVSGDISINAGDAEKLFDITYAGTDIVVSTKSADAIAESTGLTKETAAVLSNVANSTSAELAAVSLAAQEALASGDTEYVEGEFKKLAPEDKPVVQAVASSVQNQVIGLASNRMAAVSGRSGGELALTGAGVWAQGLFNKSKLNDVFHGYTRGVSAGIDEVIEHDFTLGLGYSFANTDITENGGRKLDITSNTLFLYAQYNPTQWFINGIAHYTLGTYKEKATLFDVFEKTSKHGVDSFGGNITAGYKFASGATPELGIRYLHVKQDEYVDSLGTKVVSDNTDLLTSVAGVKYVFDIYTNHALVFHPELRAAATYDIITDKANATVMMPGTNSYVVKNENLSRVGGEFGAGLAMNLYGVELSVNYDLTIHKDYTSQTGMVKARFEF